MTLLRINSENPQSNGIEKAVACLCNGGVIVYPTDTVYGMGCDINKPRAVERVAKIKGVQTGKANFTFICHDLSHLSDFTKPVDTSVFKLMKKSFPGPFTFILEANRTVPKIFHNKKKTIGIRIPDNNIIREIVKTLGNPLLNTSVHDDDDLLEYTTDPELIYERFKNKVDMVIAGDYGNMSASTIVDCTEGTVKIIRQGLGILEGY